MKNKIANDLKEFEKRNPFRRAKVGRFYIINLDNLPDWDNLFLVLINFYRKVNLGKVWK